MYSVRKKRDLEAENMKLRHYVSLAGDDSIPQVKKMGKLALKGRTIQDSSDPFGFDD